MRVFLSSAQEALTLALSRSTGRGDKTRYQRHHGIDTFRVGSSSFSFASCRAIRRTLTSIFCRINASPGNCRCWQ